MRAQRIGGEQVTAMARLLASKAARLGNSVAEIEAHVEREQAKHDAIFRARTDHAYCVSVLSRHSARQGRQYRRVA